MKPIDLSALQKPLTLLEAWSIFKHYSAPWKIGIAAILITAFAPLVIFCIFSSAIIQDGGALVFLLMLSGFGIYGLWDLYKEVNENALLQRVARVSNLDLYGDYYPKDYTGFPFSTLGMFIPRAVRTRWEQFVEFGHMRPQAAQRRSQSAKTYTYLRIKLPQELPHIIIKRDSRLSLISMSTDAHAFRLEGEFGKKFIAYVPKGYEQDTLYLFTPDVMERFLDAAPEFDVEIIGTDLYFYSHKKIALTDPRNIAKLMTIVSYIMPKFSRQSSRYTDGRPADLTSGGSTPGNRLAFRPSALSIIVSGLFLALAATALYIRFTS